MRSFLFRCGLLGLFALAAAAGVRGAERCANGPLPERPDTLRILGVGNSFTDDGMMYLPDLLRAAGIGNVVLGRLYFPGCTAAFTKTMRRITPIINRPPTHGRP